MYPGLTRAHTHMHTTDKVFLLTLLSDVSTKFRRRMTLRIRALIGSIVADSCVTDDERTLVIKLSSISFCSLFFGGFWRTCCKH